MIEAFRNFFATFYSVPFYQRYVKDGKGYGLGFLFLVTLILSLGFAIQIGGPLKSFLDEREALFASLPTLTLKDGTFTATPPEPTEISFLEKAPFGPLKVVFDTNRSEASDGDYLKRIADEKIVATILKNKIILFDPETGKTEITDGQGLSNIEISHEVWAQMGQKIVSVFLPLFAVLSFLISWSNHMVLAFLGALALMVAGWAFKTRLSLAAGMRLASAAKVPVATVLLFAPPHPLLPLVLWCGFATFGLIAVYKAQK